MELVLSEWFSLKKHSVSLNCFNPLNEYDCDNDDDDDDDDIMFK